MTNNSVKYEVLVKQYLPAFMDISEGDRTRKHKNIPEEWFLTILCPNRNGEI